MNTYPDFLVRIGCITYNHAPYIEDAMNGFCMQQTTFPFVATIIDDASTDGEPEVIRNYLNVHFDLSEEGLSRQWENDDAYFIYAQHRENKNCYFAVVLLKYNFYSIKKSKAPLIKDWIETKYVALCEGDDYWVDQQKLELQIDFLEKNPEYSMCAHAVCYVQDGNCVKTDRISELECDLQLQDLIARGGDFLSTPSLVLRRENAKQIPNFRKLAKVGDYPLVLHMGMVGKVHFFPNIMSHYRYMSVGSWTQSHRGEGRYQYFLNEVDWLEEFNRETNYKFDAAVKYRIASFARILMYRGNIDTDAYKKCLKIINIFKLKKEYRNDYIGQLITYRYGKYYSYICKIWQWIKIPMIFKRSNYRKCN